MLGACALPDKPRPAVTYDFGPGQAQSGQSVAPTAPALVLADVEASPALEGQALLYRLAYADPLALQPYAQARWSMPPAQLLRKQLRESLSASRAVLQPGESIGNQNATWQLRVELEEFSQVFESPSASHGLVRLRASVTQATAKGDRLLGQRWVSVQRPASSPDAPGGVRALAQASQAAVAELDAWLGQLR